MVLLQKIVGSLGRRPATWLLLCWLAFTTTGILSALPQPTSPPPVAPFEAPLDLDAYNLGQLHRRAGENAERFRLRVKLSPAAFEDPSASDATVPPANASHGAEPTPTTTASYHHKLLNILVVLIVWVVVMRKLAPLLADYLDKLRHFRIRLLPGLARQRPALLPGQKSVSEFHAALRARVTSPEASASRQASIVNHTIEAGLLVTAAGHLKEMHRLLLQALRRSDQVAQRKVLLKVLDQVRALKNLPQPAELVPLRQLAGAVELLLNQLTEKASHINSSSLRTISLGVTMLEELCRPGLRPDLLTEPPLRLLAVDDETFSRFALVHSLKRGLSKLEVVEDGKTALPLAVRHAYDLIVLDVMMPDMNGFELCSEIQKTKTNRATPVVFVTAARDFDTRAKSIFSDGKDHVAKPFLTFELNLKALTLMTGKRLRDHFGTADLLADKPKSGAPTSTLCLN